VSIFLLTLIAAGNASILVVTTSGAFAASVQGRMVYGDVEPSKPFSAALHAMLGVSANVEAESTVRLAWRRMLGLQSSSTGQERS
jgi:hypothetical protein